MYTGILKSLYCLNYLSTIKKPKVRILFNNVIENNTNLYVCVYEILKFDTTCKLVPQVM